MLTFLDYLRFELHSVFKGAFSTRSLSNLEFQNDILRELINRLESVTGKKSLTPVIK